MNFKEKLMKFLRRLHIISNKQLTEGNQQDLSKNSYESSEVFSDKLKREYPINDNITKNIEHANKSNNRLYDESILLIGPSGTGKSTVAEELKRITGMPRLCLDRIANYNRRTGYTKEFRNNEEHNLHMIKTELEKAKKNGNPGIVDFGAGHSVYDDIDKFNELKNMLSNFKNIILLLPSKDIEESLRIMNERSTGDTRENCKFITSLCNRELATITIYGNNRNPSEIAEEILRAIKNRENEKENEMKIKK